MVLPDVPVISGARVFALKDSGAEKSALSSAVSFPPSFFLLLPVGFSWMHEFPRSPSPSDVLEHFVPYPCLSLTVSPPKPHLTTDLPYFLLLSLAFRQAGFLDAERSLFSSHPHGLLRSALPFPLPRASLLSCSPASLGLPASTPLALKNSAFPKVLWLSASLPAPCPSAATTKICCRDPAWGISAHRGGHDSSQLEHGVTLGGCW